MKRIVMTLVATFIIGLAVFCVAYAGQSDPNSISEKPSTEAIPAPSKPVAPITESKGLEPIKLPEGVKMPVQLKCPVHGIIGKAFIAIETDTGTRIYCAQCAKTFIAKVFDLNLPKLEVVK